MESSFDVEERAAEWLAKRDAEGWSDIDEAALQAWLNASIANRVAYLRLNAVWQQANRLRALGAGLKPGAVPPPGEWRQSPFFESPSSASQSEAASIKVSAESGEAARASSERHPLSWFAKPAQAIAASLVVAVVLGGGWYLWPAGPSFRTAVGGLAAVPMTDGSKITLNTDSEVRVEVTDAERRVELTQGEAFFEVTKDAARPFVVEAGHQRFTAVGTKFSVRREGAASRLVVTEGRVRVESNTALGHESVPATEVAAGGVARTGEAGVLVEKKPVEEVEFLLSWRSGYLYFKDTTLANAAAEFNRYNTRKIVIEDATVGSIVIGGNFRANNVEAFVRLLEDGAFPIHTEHEQERIILTDSRNPRTQEIPSTP